MSDNQSENSATWVVRQIQGVAADASPQPSAPGGNTLNFAHVSRSLIDDWAAEQDIEAKHAKANHIVRACQHRVDELNLQLQIAEADLRAAQTIKHMTHVPPEWRCTLSMRAGGEEDSWPGILQQACKNFGYEYYVFHGQVYMADGRRCGITEAELR